MSESPFFESRDRQRRSPRKILAFAAAATVLLAVGVAAYLTRGTPSGAHFTTPVGGTASVPLVDGSNITLNTATSVRVDLSLKERRVDLERGEAFFVVAKDPSRPFVVEAGAKRVIAVGTQFSVRREGNEVRVVVTEGTVRLESVGERVHVSRSGSGSVSGAGAESGAGSGADASASGAEGSAASEFARLSAGTIARASDGDVLVQEESVSQAEEALSWRLGYLTFHETTLAEVVEEFNRYNTHRIVIADPKVAVIRISGTFRPTNYEAFVRLLESGYSIRSRVAGEETVLALN